MNPQEFIDNLESNINDYLAPGIFRIVCIPENKALFLPVFSCYIEGRDFFDDLEEGICQNEDLLKDYQKYGPTNEHGETNFTIDIQLCDWGFLENLNPPQILENKKKTWQGKFY